ncbi:beta-channel forming cytolysin [Bacillus thuringiensis]|uniref:beta-channel forming cytolysin n=1 Tax=Bacillus thuringiensis TaxID=1428 RepID=UPI000E4B8D03|nr:beta-channel forming cytolysin [Bacillus thuringiensis]MDZ3952386.1 beta-channel forming cytolysin [Bacillus thuringiensis]
MFTKQRIISTIFVVTVGVGSMCCSSPVSAEKIKEEYIGKDAYVYKNYDTYQDGDIKSSLTVSFIDDPNSNKRFAIITNDGSNISADYTQFNTYWYSGSLRWPSAYYAGMEITSNNAQFHNMAPKNENQTHKVTSTVTYNIGGALKIAEKPDVSATAGTSWSTSVSYDQKDYSTVVERDNDTVLKWKIRFNSLDNSGWGHYNRDSWNPTYGNQLLMKSRTKNWAEHNFLSKDEVPSLTGYSFSPATIGVVMTDKNTSKSTIKVSFKRVSDHYYQKHDGIIQWRGENTKDAESREVEHTYQLDWGKHTISRLN